MNGRPPGRRVRRHFAVIPCDHRLRSARSPPPRRNAFQPDRHFTTADHHCSSTSVRENRSSRSTSSRSSQVCPPTSSRFTSSQVDRFERYAARSTNWSLPKSTTSPGCRVIVHGSRPVLGWPRRSGTSWGRALVDVRVESPEDRPRRWLQSDHRTRSPQELFDEYLELEPLERRPGAHALW